MIIYDLINKIRNNLNKKINDKLYIETQTLTVEIYDVYGRQHNNISASQQGNETNINISNLNNGVYFVRVKTENGEMVKRFVKE